MTMKKRCPSCGANVKVVDVPLGHGMPCQYLCENNHKLIGHERIYRNPTEWDYTPLKVVDKWYRWDEDLTAEYIK